MKLSTRVSSNFNVIPISCYTRICTCPIEHCSPQATGWKRNCLFQSTVED